MSGKTPDKEKPSQKPSLIKDLLTGREPPVTTCSSTPLLPTTTSLPRSLSSSIGRYIDKIGTLEKERDAEVDVFLRRDEDFEREMGFSDTRTLVPNLLLSSSEDEHTNEIKNGKERKDDNISTTMAEFLDKQAKEKSHDESVKHNKDRS